MAVRFLTIADVERLLISAPPYGTGRIRFGSADDDHMTEAEALVFIEESEDFIEIKLNTTLTSPTTVVKGAMARHAACEIWKALNTAAGGDAIPPVIESWCEFIDDLVKALESGASSEEIDEGAEENRASAPWSSVYREARDEEVTLNETQYEPLTFQRIVPRTESVRSEKDGGTFYSRGTDYEIFYKSGELRRLSGGAITDGQKVFIDYVYPVPKRTDPIVRTVEIENTARYGEFDASPDPDLSSRIWPK